jgi:hypothetical protein
MAALLKVEAKGERWGKPPSERWVRKEQAAFRVLQPEARLPYHQFTWPEAMMGGAAGLPWRATAAALELLREHNKRGLPRPVQALVRWFYRVSEAVPTLSFEKRLEIASYLHGCEVGGAIIAPISWRRLEARLATGEDEGPWFGEDLGQRFMLTFSGTEGLSEVLMALNPMFTRWAADTIVGVVENGIPGSEIQGRMK